MSRPLYIANKKKQHNEKIPNISIDSRLAGWKQHRRSTGSNSTSCDTRYTQKISFLEVFCWLFDFINRWKKLWDPCDRFESFLKIIDIPSTSRPIPTCLFSFAIVQRQSKKGKKRKERKSSALHMDKNRFWGLSALCSRWHSAVVGIWILLYTLESKILTNSGVTCEGSDEDFTAI